MLDQTFNDVDLVGHPLTIGNFITQSAISAIFSVQTNTYTPYIRIGDDASPGPLNDQIIQGTSYQEVLTNFPLGSQIITGLFLQMKLIAADGTVTSYQRTLADRIGEAARQSGALSGSLSVQPGAPPLVSPLDLTTVDITEGSIDANVVTTYQNELNTLSSALENFQSELGQVTGILTNDALASQATALTQNIIMLIERSRIASYLSVSDLYTSFLAPRTGVVAYVASPRLTLIQSTASVSSNNTLTIALDADLINDGIRAIAEPGQNVVASIAFLVQRGFLDTGFETAIFATPAQTGQSSQINTPVSTQTVFSLAQQQGIPLQVLLPANQQALDALPLSADAKAYMSAALAQGEIIVVPVQSVLINGRQRVGWYQMNPSTGETIGVMDNGSHDTNEEVALLQIQQILTNVAAFGFGVLAGLTVSGTFGGAIKELLISTGVGLIAGEKAKALAEIAFAIASVVEALKAFAEADPTLAFFYAGVIAGLAIGKANLLKDPPAPAVLVSPAGSAPPATNAGAGAETALATLSGGVAVGSIAAPNAEASGTLTATWSSTATNSFQVETATANTATVVASNGAVIGSGAVTLSMATPEAIAVSGQDQYTVAGTGTLAFYGAGQSTLGVGGSWTNYSAALTGNISLTLTVPQGALTLNGQALPAGTYIVTTNLAAITGSGQSSDPSFSGSVSITATTCTLNLGPGSGTLSVGGKPLNPDGRNDPGRLQRHDYRLGQRRRHRFRLAQWQRGQSPPGFDQSHRRSQPTRTRPSRSRRTSRPASPTPTTSQPTPRPAGRSASTAAATSPRLPAPGLQSGTYPIQIIAQSQTDSNLVAQTTVDVTITPTQPGINFTIASDPIFTVPFDGAQLPTAFRATIQNLGPAADTYNLTFANVPSGFTLQNSGTSVTVPAARQGSSASTWCRTPASRSRRRARSCLSTSPRPARQTRPSPRRRPSHSPFPRSMHLQLRAIRWR